MRFIKILLFFCFILLSPSLHAQSDTKTDTTSFEPTGKIIAVSFFDYSSGLNSRNDDSGFDLTRALLGYKYNFHPNFEATISIDGAAGRSTNDKVEVHVRNAYLSWKNHGFRVKLGLIPLQQFGTQVKLWGHRYAFRSQQDLAGMGHAVDIGLFTSYNFNKYIAADIAITNGEGYKKIKKDKSMKYAIGTTIKPFDFLTFRFYADIYTGDRERFDAEEIGESIKNQFTYTAFVGYDNHRFNVGAEYNKQHHNQYIKGNNIDAFSIYSTVRLAPKWNVYVRYDLYDSSTRIDNQRGWYDDRQLVIAGVEYKPFKFLKFSPSFRNYNYAQEKSEQYIFVSGEFKF